MAHGRTKRRIESLLHLFCYCLLPIASVQKRIHIFLSHNMIFCVLNLYLKDSWGYDTNRYFILLRIGKSAFAKHQKQPLEMSNRFSLRHILSIIFNSIQLIKSLVLFIHEIILNFYSVKKKKKKSIVESALL